MSVRQRRQSGYVKPRRPEVPNAHLKAIPIETHPRSDDMPKQYEKGRPCSGCGRVLSIWNAGPTCYACDEALAKQRAATPLMLDRAMR